MDLIKLQTEVASWQAKNFPTSKPYQPLLGALEELGELAHAHLKGEQGIRHTPIEIHAKKKDAVADIIIYLTHYCELEGIIIDEAIEDTWHEVKKRDWKTNPLDADKRTDNSAISH